MPENCVAMVKNTTQLLRAQTNGFKGRSLKTSRNCKKVFLVFSDITKQSGPVGQEESERKDRRSNLTKDWLTILRGVCSFFIIRGQVGPNGKKGVGVSRSCPNGFVARVHLQPLQYSAPLRRLVTHLLRGAWDGAQDVGARTPQNLPVQLAPSFCLLRHPSDSFSSCPCRRQKICVARSPVLSVIVTFTALHHSRKRSGCDLTDENTSACMRCLCKLGCQLVRRSRWCGVPQPSAGPQPGPPGLPASVAYEM